MPPLTADDGTTTMTATPRHARHARTGTGRRSRTRCRAFRSCGGRPTYDSLSEQISEITEKPQPCWWWPAFLISASLLTGGVLAATYLISTGVGVWGSNVPVAWAFDITNFVFWIGIGHAGTLICAILFLFRQKWRTSINRFSEAMTIFAVICAVRVSRHPRRPVLVRVVLFPLPNANHIFQNFRSALLWDFFAVSTYFTISLIFWYIGLIPDLAHAPRPREEPLAADGLRLPVARLARQHAALAALRGRVPDARRPLARRWCCRSTRW